MRGVRGCLLREEVVIPIDAGTHLQEVLESSAVATGPFQLGNILEDRVREREECHKVATCCFHRGCLACRSHSDTRVPPDRRHPWDSLAHPVQQPAPERSVLDCYGL